MQSPTNEVDTIAIDNTTGNRLWQRRQGFTSSTVSFTYDGSSRLTAVSSNAGSASYTYNNVLGNLATSVDEASATTTYLQNASGADTSVAQEIGGSYTLRNRIV